MGNCLVTKLKGVVNNDMLPHLGFAAFEIAVDSPIIVSDCYATLNNPNPGTSNVRILGDGYFVDSNNSNIGKELDTSVTPFDKTGDYKGIYIGSRIVLEIYDYDNNQNRSENAFFDFRIVSSLEVDIDTIARIFPKYNNGIIFAPTLKGNIKNFYNRSGNYCSIQASKDGSKVTGNIEDIVANSNEPSVIGLNNLTNVTGSIEGFLNKMLTKWSITREKFRFEIINCPKITYQGEAIGSSFYRNFHYNGTTWEEVQ